jgi:penicillin-binding protein 1A
MPIVQRKTSWVSIIAIFFSLILLASGAGFAFLSSIAKNLPNVDDLIHFQPPIVSSVTASDGQLIGEFFKERRYVLPYEAIPEMVIKAFVAAEDENFFTHSGIQITSMLRAALANFRARHVVQGGSTITQQVVKSLLLTPERSLDRKIKEIILAFRIERHLTKEQVLFLYLNHIYLGHGCYGVAAACQVYFGKPLSQITLPEAAILAGLPQAPAKYNPVTNPKKAKERQSYVLKRLSENQIISQEVYQDALNQPVKIFADRDINTKIAPYMVEQMRRFLLEKYGEDQLYKNGLLVHSTAHASLSMKATTVLQEGLREVDKRAGFRGVVKHLKSEKEIQHFRNENRKTIFLNLGYQFLTKAGVLDAVLAAQSAGANSELEIIEKFCPDKIASAVITRVDRDHHSCEIALGIESGVVHFVDSKWALRSIDPKTLELSASQPATLSDVFKVGDVVQVRLVDKDKSLFTLEQEPVVQGALLCLDLQTGDVLSMVGGFDFDKSEFNRAIQASRQMGSAFKPIIYATALENGFTPATIIVDSPVVFKDGTGQSWKPNNYEEKFYGDTTFRQALIKSRNIPTIKIVQQLGVSKVIESAKRYGLTGNFPVELSVALGSISVPLLDLARAYSVFARLGRKMEVRFFTNIEDRDEHELEKTQPALPLATPDQLASLVASIPAGAILDPTKDPQQILDPRVAFIMTHLMNEVVRYGTGHRAKELNQTAAGKTGTTNDSVDAWFFGYTPRILTAVWVGHDTQKSIGVGETGAKAALPIWLNFMKEAVKYFPAEDDFVIPPGVVFVNIDPQTGALSTRGFSQAIQEAFVSGTEPKASEKLGKPKTRRKEDFYREDL